MSNSTPNSGWYVGLGGLAAKYCEPNSASAHFVPLESGSKSPQSSPSTNRRSTPSEGGVFLNTSPSAMKRPTPDAPSFAPRIGRALLPKFGSSSAVGRVSQWVRYSTRDVAVGL